jgi:hypothetical protein
MTIFLKSSRRISRSLPTVCRKSCSSHSKLLLSIPDRGLQKQLFSEHAICKNLMLIPASKQWFKKTSIYIPIFQNLLKGVSEHRKLLIRFILNKFGNWNVCEPCVEYTVFLHRGVYIKFWKILCFMPLYKLKCYWHPMRDGSIECKVRRACAFRDAMPHLPERTEEKHQKWQARSPPDTTHMRLTTDIQ